MKIYLLAILLSAIFSIIIGALLLPILKRLKLGQTILGYVVEHASKNGTATMGGIFFILSSLIVFLILSSGNRNLSFFCIVISISFGIVGLIDDFIKIKFSRNLGLTSTQKILFQLSISIIASIYAYKNGITMAYIPFTTKLIELGVAGTIFNVFIFISLVNSVNLLDGLDGLCSNVTLTYLIFISIISFVEIYKNKNSYVSWVEYQNLFIYVFAVVGGLLGFLAFNTNKASVFMGDTGSLMLGGVISIVSIFTGNSLYVAILGIVYLITSLSVIMQVIYFKKTKKRIFLMSPLHHHFQKLNLTESKISYLYTLMTTIIGLFILIIIL